jgi:hypothetical protein
MFDSFATLLDSLVEVASTGRQEVAVSTQLPAQLLRLAEVTRDREPRLRSAINRWLTTLEALGLGLTPRQLTLLGAYTSILTRLSTIGATWHLIDATPATGSPAR